jgi:predicted transcriptional regulator
MVAVRVQTIKPKLIVIHGAPQTDKLATHLAELERIPLISSRKPNVEALLDALNRLYVDSSRRNRFG